VDSVPVAKQLSEDNNKNPEEIKRSSDRLIEEFRTDKDNLLANIERNKTNGTISEDSAEDLKNRVMDTAIQGPKLVQEASNVAIDTIDDSNATAHLIYEMIVPLALTNRPILTVVSVVLKLCFDKDVKYLSSIYYNIHKNKINSGCISVLLLVILLVVYYSPVTYCDAPRA
jgi:hypothetical protein